MKLVIEIRIHGRGGQGNIVAAQILAIAAFRGGKYCQAFGSFGPERRGMPVKAFVRIDDKPIKARFQVYEPDYIIVQDPSLLSVENVTEGLKKEGVAVINAEKPVNLGVKTYWVNATKIAKDVIGMPITNTAMLGAFIGATKLVSFNSLEDAIRERLGKVAEPNIKAAELAYKEVKEYK